MRSRIFFGLIAGFWLVMNFLLWRSQSLAHNQIGSAIPVEIVWDKILTAPDNSSLDIYDHDKKVGFCHWVPVVGGAAQYGMKASAVLAANPRTDPRRLRVGQTLYLP